MSSLDITEVAKHRFLAKVSVKDGCWEWQGANKGNGYGHTSKGPAHRVSYQMFVGSIPDGHDVCHKCDNRCCVNPTHLFVGTRLDNMRDCKTKGRTARGAAFGDRKADKAGNAKLSWDAVREIRASSEASRAIAQRYGISSDNINRIRRHETWKVL